jgi:hypothetical protein
MDDELKAKLDRIEKKLSFLVSQRKAESRKKTWVKVSVVQDLTGWNREKLRQMREHGLIAYQRNETGMWYQLESIHPIFLKTNAGDKSSNDK